MWIDSYSMANSAISIRSSKSGVEKPKLSKRMVSLGSGRRRGWQNEHVNIFNYLLSAHVKAERRPLPPRYAYVCKQTNNA